MRLLPSRGTAKGGQAMNCPHCRSGHDPVLKDSTWSCGVRFNDPQWRTKECYKRQLVDSQQHVTELESRLHALFDKYYSDANYYEKRMCALIEAGNSMYEFINPPTPCMRTTRMDNLLQGWDDAKIGKEAKP